MGSGGKSTSLQAKHQQGFQGERGKRATCPDRHVRPAWEEGRCRSHPCLCKPGRPKGIHFPPQSKRRSAQYGESPWSGWLKDSRQDLFDAKR